MTRLIVLLVLAATLAGWSWGDRAFASVPPAKANAVPHLVDSTLIATVLTSRAAQVIQNGYGYGGYSGNAAVGNKDTRVWLSPWAYRDARTGGGKGLLVLLHEVGHVTGIADERQATCYALAQLRPVLREFFRVTGREAARRVRDAAALLRSMPSEYREGACA